MQRIFRAASLALAFSLGWVHGAKAGESSGATFSQTSPATVAGIGPGETVTISIDVTGVVNAKNLTVFIQVSDPAAFDMGSMGLQFSGDFSGAQVIGSGALVSGSTDILRQGGAQLSGTINGDGSAVITLKTSDSFTTDTQAGITVTGFWVGADASVLTSPDPDPNVHDLFGADDVGAAVVINPPVTQPTLSATTPTDASVDFSATGTGSAQDGSDGEVELAAVFTDASGGPAAGQAITWVVTNNGAESVFILGATSTEVAAGSEVTVTATTDADGLSGVVLDAEGDKLAGSTSASVAASTSADNSDGVSVDLSVSYSVTWDVPVPAELASFTGQADTDRGVLLQWGVSSQTNNLGWEVYRSMDNRLFVRVGELISGAGTSDTFRQYAFLDEEVPPADVVYYYLRQVDLNGTATRSSVLEVALAPTGVLEQSLPMVTALNQNYPNPFNPETTIQFELAAEASVSLRVFDTTGQTVRTLVLGSLPAGTYTQVWDGRNGAGLRVGSGIYFYELKAGAFTSMKKMTLLQ